MSDPVLPRECVAWVMLDVFSDVGGLAPWCFQGGVKLAALRERSRYSSALPFRVGVCDEAPMLAHSCAGKPAGASGGTLPGCYFAGDLSSEFEALPSP